MSEPNGAGVNYSVKELLAKIEGKLDGVIITIGQKADRHDVENLSQRVAILETDRSGSRAVRELFRWAVPVVAVIVAALIAHYFR